MIEKWDALVVMSISLSIALITCFAIHAYSSKQRVAMENGYEEVTINGSEQICWQKAKP